ncbi:MAG: ribosomal protein L7/L12 [Nitrospirae bacterium]|nr:ribosomal protein L7/L12 [Nitrospirota bacterium]
MTGQQGAAGDDLPAEAAAAIEAGRKIEAIKIVRKAKGLDLKDAKDLVDRYVEARPHLQRKLAEAQAESKRGCVIWLLTLLAAGLGLVYLLKGR